jgi:hypothetical protein
MLVGEKAKQRNPKPQSGGTEPMIHFQGLYLFSALSEYHVTNNDIKQFGKSLYKWLFQIE